MIAKLTKKIQSLRSLFKRTNKPVRWHFIILACSIIVTIGVVGMGYANPVYALDLSINGLIAGAARVIFWLAFMVMKATLWALGLLIAIAGYSGFSDSPIVNMGWTLVRDLANMFFIVALLVIAFATILGREDYALKKTLGKLLLMAILVNFSKLISQVVIDAAHVVTMTFLNAVSAVAGGNAIQMFNFSDLKTMVTEQQSTGATEDINIELLGAAMLTMLFTTVAFTTMFAYMIILLYRMVTLWILIIISPLAYAAAAIPLTAGFAKEWWKQFQDNVLVAPILVFFLWLAFSTLGNGVVLSQVTDPAYNSLPAGQLENYGKEAENLERQGSGPGGGTAQKLSLSSGTTWDNMAGFAIAVGFLFAGIERVQSMKVGGTDMVGKAKNMGVKFGLGASGVFAAGWAGKQIVKRAPVVGTDSLKRKGKEIQSRMSIKKTGFDQWRDEATGNNQFLKSGRYKDKIVSNWEKSAENRKKMYDEEISTGGTKSGAVKLDTAVKADIAESRASQAKKRKFEKEKKVILEGEQGEHLDTYKEEKLDIENKVAQDASLKTPKDKKEALNSRLKGLDDKYKGKMRYSMLTKETYDYERESSVLSGEVKDLGQKIQGKRPKFAEQAQRKLIAEDMEVFEGQSLEAMKAMAEQLQKETSQEFSIGNISGAQTKMRDLQMLRAVAAEKGSYEISEIDNALAVGAGLTGKIDSTDLVAQSNRQAAMITGNTDSTSAEHTAFREFMGDESMIHVNKRGNQARKKAALDGYVASDFGMYNETSDGEGGITIKVLDPTNDIDKGAYRKNQDAISEYLSVDKLTDVNGIISVEYSEVVQTDDKNKPITDDQGKQITKIEPEYSIKTDADAEKIISVLRTIKGNSKLSTSFMKNITEKIDATSQTLKGKIRDGLSQENKEAIDKQLTIKNWGSTETTNQNPSPNQNPNP